MSSDYFAGILTGIVILTIVIACTIWVIKSKQELLAEVRGACQTANVVYRSVR
jgi:hypothetical protein